MTRYVLGFVFDDTGDNVVLIRKTKPAWQAGKFNGVGGKIEEGEGKKTAMVREFHEEAGVMTLPDNWTQFAVMGGPKGVKEEGGWEVICFYTFNSFIVRKTESKTEEEVHSFPVFIASSEIPTISNVPWLIAAARNHKQNSGEFMLEARYV